MDLAEDGSDDGTSTPMEKGTGMIPPAPADQNVGTILPAHTKTQVWTTPPAPTGKVAGITPEQPTDPKQKGSPKPNRLATSSCGCCHLNHDDSEDEQKVRCFLEWLCLDTNSKRMLDNEMKMLAHYECNIGNNAVPPIQHAVHEKLELIPEAQQQITAAMYKMCDMIVQFNTWLHNISYCTSGEWKTKADTESGGRKWERMEWQSVCFSFELMGILWVCSFPLSSWFSFGSAFVSFCCIDVNLMFFWVWV